MTIAIAGGNLGSVPVQETDPIQRLIGLEMSAQAAYQLAADAAGDGGSDRTGLLRQLQEEHELAAHSLQEHCRESGGESGERSGSLGIWSGPARLAREGNAAAMLKQLQAAERRLLDEYEAANAAVDPGTAQLLQNLMIPAQQRHVRMLQVLTSAASPNC